MNRRYDLCAELKANNVSLQCPIEPGRYEVMHTVELPSRIPPGARRARRRTDAAARFSVNIQGDTQDGKPLVCMNVSVSFTPFLQMWRKLWSRFS